MSNRPIRWFTPPPIFTAIFSRIRIPGVVLRVSSTRVFVPSNTFAYLRVIVAIPLIRCITFNIRRSVWSKDCTFPSTTIATSPGFTSVPSLINTSTFMVGSKRLKISLATSMPANTPASLISNFDFPIAVAGIHERVVWSPSPISSAKARSINLSISSFSLFIDLVNSYLMY